MAQPLTCNVCSTSGKLKKCSRCSTVAYCSRTCQKLAWPTHKQTCTSPIYIYNITATAPPARPPPPESRLLTPTRTLLPTRIPFPNITPTTPTSTLTYVGLVGDPRTPTTHELFRCFLTLPTASILLFNPDNFGDLAARGAISSSIVGAAADAIGAKKERPCVGTCGQMGKKYRHLLEVYWGGEEAATHDVVDVAIIWCERKECEEAVMRLQGEYGWRNWKELGKAIQVLVDEGREMVENGRI
ncbi:hypothetical protein BJ508DRAFT_325761 [Ascobolus immersus RN42]|uniref:MYND-type domain-containing protein n=1 Tax=Ascobolus immersus RN42 TaxID=1160509 RepID=A0A3N4IC45_ASCIM|nr:hypothetical protein BJ508DRAFT_325761 [Ascobolus immersus RN42]